MLKICTILVALLLTVSAAGQNLVPNPSFEEYDFCSSQTNGPGWASSWFAPYPGSSPDYFNACSEYDHISVPTNYLGFQEARSGEAYVGFFSYYFSGYNGQEFLSIQLESSLISGTQYVFTSFFSLADNARYNVDKLGYLVSDSFPSSTPINELTPSYENGQVGFFNDTANWVRMTDTITAAGGEIYLIIGCFNQDPSVDTVYVGNGDLVLAYHFLDDVSLIPLDSLLTIETVGQIPFNLYPNPATETVQIELRRQQKVEVLVSDVLGREVYHEIPRSVRNDKLVLDVSNWPNGIYLVSVIGQNGVKSTQRLVVQH